MNATKKYFPADDHATMFNLLTHFDFDSVSSQITLIYIFNIAKLYPFLYCVTSILFFFFSTLHNEQLRVNLKN